jgi:hypothetical protein
MSVLEIILLLGGYLIFLTMSSSSSMFALAQEFDTTTSVSSRRLNTRGIPYPDFRYVPWSQLDADLQTDAESILQCKKGTGW